MKDLILAGLKFKGQGIAEACRKEENTQPAMYLIGFYVVMRAVLAFFQGNSGDSGIAGAGLTGFSASIAEFFSFLIGTFLSALIMVYVLKIFKKTATYQEVIRLYGAAVIWSILGAVFAMLLPGSTMFGVLFWLAYNFALLFGMMAYLDMVWWKAFLSIVLTFIGVFIVMIIYGVIVPVIF